MRHTALDRSDARPGVQPAAQRLDLHGAPARLPPEAREVQRRQQQASTRIEHWRESTIVPQDRQGARTMPASSSSRIVMMAESSSPRAENSDPSFSLGRLAVYTPRPKAKRPRRRPPGPSSHPTGPKE